jgi:hypothetical protein
LRTVENGDFERLQSSCFSVLSAGNVEEHAMRVQLRRGITIHGPGGIVLELRHDPFPGRYSREIAADARLCVSLQLVECDADALPVGLPYAVITPNQCSQTQRFWRAETHIKSGPMLGSAHLFTMGVDVFVCALVLHKLLAGLRMQTLRQPLKVLLLDRAV